MPVNFYFNPVFKIRLDKVIAGLCEWGYKPIIVSGRRTLAEQKILLAQGKTKTLHSKHLTGKAADVVDLKMKWNAPNRFWLQMAFLVNKYGLKSGIYFGLSTVEKKQLKAKLDNAIFKTDVKIGWDPNHIEL